MFKFFLTILFTLSVLSTALSARVDTIDVWSNAMRKQSRCIVIVPDSYSVSAAPYSVLYLLHGWSGNYAGWLTDAPQLLEHSDRYNLIVVCPDGGYDSWYVDSPVDTSVRYETYISKELPGYVDYYYHTRQEKAGRAIAGVSMGGHGALTLTAKHPDTFGAAGSMAGGLDLRPFKKNNWDLEGVLGNPDRYWANWESVSAVNMVEQLKLAHIPLMIDCGIGDFFLPVNRSMHAKLLEMGVPHEYTERPGAHNRDYWSEAIDYQFLFFDKFFNNKNK